MRSNRVLVESLSPAWITWSRTFFLKRYLEQSLFKLVLYFTSDLDGQVREIMASSKPDLARAGTMQVTAKVGRNLAASMQSCPETGHGGQKCMATMTKFANFKMLPTSLTQVFNCSQQMFIIVDLTIHNTQQYLQYQPSTYLIVAFAVSWDCQSLSAGLTLN